MIGLAVGFIGVFIMKMTQDGMSELILILLAAYGAFELAEHFHLAGLLAVIVAVITLNTITEKSLKVTNRRVRKGKRILNKTNTSRKIFSTRFMGGITTKLNEDITSIERHKQNLNYVALLALLANAFLFISMASIIHIDTILEYSNEILWMFAITTLIRVLMMTNFALLSNRTSKMTDINFRWWSVLLFAGIKGGLSIVMLQMLPSDFAHKELFEAIVIGIILLSTIIYALILVGIMLYNKRIFEKEYESELH